MPRADRNAQQSALRIWSIPVQAVYPNPHQPRRAFDGATIEALAESIRQVGLLQPISVRVVDASCYELIAGERRLRACKLLGLSHIDAVVLIASEVRSALLALVENLQRENLHYLDEAEGYASVLHDCDMTQEALAVRIGKSQSTIANKLRLLKLDGAVREALRKEELTERHARALLRLSHGEQQLLAIRQMASQKMTVKQAEALIANLLIEAPPEEQRSNRRIIRLIRDHRLYINAIRDITKQMQLAGVDAQTEVVDHEDKVEVIVRISKQKRMAKEKPVKRQKEPAAR